MFIELIKHTMVKIMKTLIKGLLLGVLMAFPLLQVVQAANPALESASIEINPSIAVFKSISVGSGSESTTLEVRNKGAASLTVSGITISGDHANQFAIASDQCSNATLTTGMKCLIQVSYTPTQRGHKQALLEITSDSTDTPLLQAFLSSREDDKIQSSRRLPPVLYALSIPEQMTSGQSYTLSWSILGYHDDYLSSVAIFDCSLAAADTCGNNYNDANRIFTQIGADNGTLTTGWHNGDIYAKEKQFTVQFTPSVAQATDVVVRFYRLNTDDKNAGGDGLSLVIPGNLSNEYYDKQGRRIKKQLLP